MAEIKKVRAVEIKIDSKEPTVVNKMTKEEAQAIVDAYAKRNPVKYEVKKKALEAWVASF